MLAVITLTQGLMIAAGMLIVSGFLMRRASRRVQNRPIRSAVPDRATTILQRIDEREARLYDFTRTVEATYESRIVTLRELIDEATRVTDQLEALLVEAREQAVLPLLPADERSRAARSLKQAGYSDEQIEKLLDRTTDDDFPRRRAA